MPVNDTLCSQKWVGEAWERQSAKKEMIIHSFKKCGIAVAIDVSEDSEIQ